VRSRHGIFMSHEAKNQGSNKARYEFSDKLSNTQQSTTTKSGNELR